MTPDSITSLVKVREALNKAPSQYTPLFMSLTDNGTNRPHSCKPAGRLPFGPDDGDFPGLGKKLSPFNFSQLPSLESLQRLLINDLRAARGADDSGYIGDLNSTESAQTDGQDEDVKLLNTLTNGSRRSSGTVLAFPSPSLDEICGDAKVEYKNVLRESITMATVLPVETLLTLQHSNEGTTFTTLLSGSVAWVIWPPTKHNLDILQSFYEAFSKGFDGTSMNVCHQLQGGVCLVQSAGEALRIPPFCPMMSLSLRTSVLATYSVVTATQLANMLSKIPLMLTWFKTEIDGERKQKDFTTALLPHLAAILQGAFEINDLEKCKYPYTQEGPLHSLLTSWEEIKDAVASILDHSEAEQVIVMWDELLRKVKGRNCWICGKHIGNKLRDLRKHIEVQHWPTKQRVENPEQQNQLRRQGANTIASPAMSERTSEDDSFHDAMETIEPASET